MEERIDSKMLLQQLQNQLEWEYWKHLDVLLELKELEKKVKTVVEAMSNEELYAMQTTIGAIEDILEKI